MLSICAMCTPDAAGGGGGLSFQPRGTPTRWGGPIDCPAAVIRTDGLALDGLVGRKILTRDEAAMRLHVVDQDIAERPLIQRGLAMLRNVRERFRIFRLHHALAWLQRHALWQVNRRDRLVLQHIR